MTGSGTGNGGATVLPTHPPEEMQAMADRDAYRCPRCGHMRTGMKALLTGRTCYGDRS